mmetsp:Transcript_25781/g.47127  ORF Transcript_25781/g.47127 Transcript_25781/m.47127 type:complete len:508 (-) Transcript_25781:61-1584(-)
MRDIFHERCPSSLAIVLLLCHDACSSATMQVATFEAQKLERMQHGVVEDCTLDDAPLTLLQAKAALAAAKAAPPRLSMVSFKPPASELVPLRGAMQGLEGLPHYTLVVANRSSSGNSGNDRTAPVFSPFNGASLDKTTIHLQDFTREAMKIAVAVDGGSSFGFILLVVSVVAALLCIILFFLDPRWVKDSFTGDTSGEAAQQQQRHAMLGKGSRQAPPLPTPTAAAYTAGSPHWRSLPTASLPMGNAWDVGGRSSTLHALPAVGSQREGLRAPNSSPYLERVSTISAYSVTAAEPPADGRASFAGAATPQAAAVPVVRKGPPPALCKALILPHAEARFVVVMSSLTEDASSFEILGLSGRPLLKAAKRMMDGGSRRFVDLSMTPARSPILATAGIFPSGYARSGSQIKVLGAGGAPYGELQKQASARYCLQVDGEQTLSMDTSGGQMVFYNPSGANIATAVKGSDQTIADGKEHLEVRAVPGADSILILCCVLAVALFGGNDWLLAQ